MHPDSRARLQQNNLHSMCLLMLGLASGCATFQQPKPVGEPSPLACYGAKRTREAWEGLVRKYVDEMIAAQEAFSCQQPSPPAESQSLTPTACAR